MIPFLEWAADVGLVNLTPAQRVYARVAFDGTHPVNLPEGEREIAAEMFGEIDTLPPRAITSLATLAGARGGKSMLHTHAVLHRCLHVPLPNLGPGEHGYGALVSKDLRLAKTLIDLVQGRIAMNPRLQRLVESSGETSVTLKRPDGKRVTIEALPATSGGAAVRGRSYCAVFLDEFCFHAADEAFAVNAVELYRAAQPRIVPGGLLAMASTPWSTEDFLWRLVADNWGNPTTALACRAPTLLLRNYDSAIVEIVETADADDLDNSNREHRLIPLSAGSGLYFDSMAVAEASDASFPAYVPWERKSRAVVGVGVDTGLVKDSSACVIVHKRKDGVIVVAEAIEMRPTAGSPLKLSEVVATYAQAAKRHGSRECFADHHELNPSREYSQPAGLTIRSVPGGAEGKLRAYAKTKEQLAHGRLKIPSAHRRLFEQLKAVRCVAQAGGLLKITSPRKAGHGDLVSALVNAIWHVERISGRNANSTQVTDAMQGWMQQQFPSRWDPGGVMSSSLVRNRAQAVFSFGEQRAREIFGDED